MVLLGYFYRDSRDPHSTEAWSTSFNPHSTTTPAKAVGTSALKSRSKNSKPVFSSQPQPCVQSQSRSRSSSFNTSNTSNIACPISHQDPASTSSFAVSDDGTIYEWTNSNSSSSTYYPPVFTRSRLDSFASTMNPFACASASNSRTDNDTGAGVNANSGTDRKSRGRSSSVWSTSTGLSTVRSRSRSLSGSDGSE